MLNKKFLLIAAAFAALIMFGGENTWAAACPTIDCGGTAHTEGTLCYWGSVSTGYCMGGRDNGTLVHQGTCTRNNSTQQLYKCVANSPTTTCPTVDCGGTAHTEGTLCYWGSVSTGYCMGGKGNGNLVHQGTCTRNGSTQQLYKCERDIPAGDCPSTSCSGTAHTSGTECYWGSLQDGWCMGGRNNGTLVHQGTCTRNGSTQQRYRCTANTAFSTCPGTSCSGTAHAEGTLCHWGSNQTGYCMGGSSNGTLVRQGWCKASNDGSAQHLYMCVKNGNTVPVLNCPATYTEGETLRITGAHNNLVTGQYAAWTVTNSSGTVLKHTDRNIGPTWVGPLVPAGSGTITVKVSHGGGEATCRIGPNTANTPACDANCVSQEEIARVGALPDTERYSFTTSGTNSGTCANQLVCRHRTWNRATVDAIYAQNNKTCAVRATECSTYCNQMTIYQSNCNASCGEKTQSCTEPSSPGGSKNPPPTNPPPANPPPLPPPPPTHPEGECAYVGVLQGDVRAYEIVGPGSMDGGFELRRLPGSQVGLLKNREECPAEALLPEQDCEDCVLDSSTGAVRYELAPHYRNHEKFGQINGSQIPIYVRDFGDSEFKVTSIYGVVRYGYDRTYVSLSEFCFQFGCYYGYFTDADKAAKRISVSNDQGQVDRQRLRVEHIIGSNEITLLNFGATSDVPISAAVRAMDAPSILFGSANDIPNWSAGRQGLVVKADVLVPIRFIAEGLGHTVSWDSENWRALITRVSANYGGGE